MKVSRPLYTPSRRKFCFGLFLLALPLVVYGAHQAIESNSNRVRDWLPEDFKETRQLEWFVERFGSGEILVLSWEGATLDDPRVETVAAAIRKSESDRTGKRLFRAAMTPRDLLKKLTGPPLDLSRARAAARMQGWLLGPDGKTACILALVSEEGAEDRHEAVEKAYQAAEQAAGIGPDELRVGGTTVDAVEIDKASQAYLIPFNVVAYAVCIGLTYYCFRSIRVSLLIVSLALFCELLSLSNLIYSGSHMDSVSLLMASVVFVLSISASVHVVNYYREAYLAVGEGDAMEKAVRDAFVPCFLAALTTSIGLGSLGISKIVPISKFGIYASVAVIEAFVIIFLLLPSAMIQWPVKTARFPLSNRKKVKKLHGWKTLIRWVARLHAPIVLITFALMVAAGFGLTRLETTVRLHDLFFSNAKILRDYDWIEERLGPLIPVEVVVTIPKNGEEEKPLLEQMRLVEAVRRALKKVDGVEATLSASTFAPPIPRAVGFRSIARRTVMERRMESHRDDLVKANYFHVEGDHNLWRISIRVPSGKNIDYGRFMRDLRAAGNGVLQVAAGKRLPRR